MWGLWGLDAITQVPPQDPHRALPGTSHTTLVVVPKLLVDQWIEEINAHTVPHALAVRVCRTHGDIARLTVPQVLHTTPGPAGQKGTQWSISVIATSLIGASAHLSRAFWC